jgi:hypothetical protein
LVSWFAWSFSCCWKIQLVSVVCQSHCSFTPQRCQ